MAKAIANCTCKKCGKEFQKIKTNCYNRANAESWVAWAEANCTECPECYGAEVKANINAKADTLAEELNLPEITGVSEKQIAFASSLRAKALAENEASIRKIAAAMKDHSEEEILAIIEKKSYIYRKGWYTILVTGEARRIIDDLKTF